MPCVIVSRSKTTSRVLHQDWMVANLRQHCFTRGAREPDALWRAQVRNVAAASHGALRQDAAALAAEAERLGDELNAVLGSFDELQRDVAALEGEVTDEARSSLKLGVCGPCRVLGCVGLTHDELQRDVAALEGEVTDEARPALGLWGVKTLQGFGLCWLEPTTSCSKMWPRWRARSLMRRPPPG